MEVVSLAVLIIKVLITMFSQEMIKYQMLLVKVDGIVEQQVLGHMMLILHIPMRLVVRFIELVMMEVTLITSTLTSMLIPIILVHTHTL